MRAAQTSAVLACGLLAGCGGDDDASSARFVERTVYYWPGERPDTEITRGVFDWEAREGEAARAGVGERYRMIQMGDDCYRRFGDDPWRKLRADDVDGLCSAALFSDPRTELALLRSVANDFHTVGDEPVRGVETTHWRGRLNIGAVKGSIEVWVDEDEVVRRSRQADGDTSDGFTTVREYFDFGVDVEVAPPAPFREGG